MLDAILDALKDSAITFGIIFILYMLISFIEVYISKLLKKKNRFSPLMGSLIGCIPQCGLVVVATDMYTKKHVTMGTLIAIYIACSDEALPIILSNPDKIYDAIPLLLSKIVLGFIVGFVIDSIFTKHREEVNEHVDHCDKENEDIHLGCCGHKIENDPESEESLVHTHFIHPLIHSLKIFAYIFTVNLALNILIYFIGEDNISNFIQSSKYLSPLFSVIVGMIPNCASSVILTELYLINGITFCSCLGGLCCNAGLGVMMLIRYNKNKKENITIILTLVVVALIVAYLGSLIEWHFN